MPKRALTDAAVKRLKPPSEGQVDNFDAGYPGLALRIGCGGTRTWVFFTRVGTRLVRHRLGNYPAMTLAAARDAWRTAREQVQAGKPPRAATSRHKDSVEVVVADWLKRDQAQNATHDEVKAAFDKVIIPAWQGRLITSIDRRDVLDILDAAADRGKIGRARKLHAFINRFTTWCVGRGILASNPMAGLPKHGEAVQRERKLSDAEIGKLWVAAEAIGWPFGPIVQLLLLTAARKSEIAELEWSELDDTEACIRLPGRRTKTDEPRVIPLAPEVWEIATAGPRIYGSKFVFTTTGETPVSGWSKAKAALDQHMRLNEPWRLHDLRRTTATGLERLGVALPVTEAVLGHVSGSKGGIVGVYQTHRYETEKREALGRWASHVLAIVG